MPFARYRGDWANNLEFSVLNPSVGRTHDYESVV